MSKAWESTQTRGAAGRKPYKHYLHCYDSKALQLPIVLQQP